MRFPGPILHLVRGTLPDVPLDDAHGDRLSQTTSNHRKKWKKKRRAASTASSQKIGRAWIVHDTKFCRRATRKMLLKNPRFISQQIRSTDKTPRADSPRSESLPNNQRGARLGALSRTRSWERTRVRPIGSVLSKPSQLRSMIPAKTTEAPKHSIPQTAAGSRPDQRFYLSFEEPRDLLPV